MARMCQKVAEMSSLTRWLSVRLGNAVTFTEEQVLRENQTQSTANRFAMELGSKNPNYFSACFRKVTGVFSRKYRRKC